MPSVEKQTKVVKPKKPTTKSKPSTKKALLPVDFKSTEYIGESDAEGDASPAEESASDDESLPEHVVKSTTKPNGRVPAPASDGSSSEEESSSASDSGSESEDEGADEEAQDKAAGSARQIKASVEPVKKSTASKTSKVVPFEKPSRYEPPSGFQEAEIGESSQMSQKFKKSNLAGKQVWYFTAPASVPVSNIENISLQDAKKGKPILSYNDEQYGFVLAEPHSSFSNIIIPHGSGNGYRTSTKQIDQVFSLQQIPKDAGLETIASSVPSAVKQPRPQPRGMKIRFQPVGFGRKDIGDLGAMGDSESASDEGSGDNTTFRKPAAVDSDQEMTEAPLIAEKSSSKPKKERKEKKNKQGDKSSTDGSHKRKHGEEKEKKHKSKKSDRNPDHAKRSISVN